MNRFILMILAAILVAALGAQDFQLTADYQAQRHELRVGDAEEVKLTLNGVAAGETYEIYLDQDREDPNYFVAAFPPGADRIHGSYLSGVGNGTPVEFCLGAHVPRTSTLFVSVRKHTDPGFRPKSMMDFTTTSSTDLDFLLNTVFRNESCFELIPDSLVGGDNVLNDGRRVTQTGTFRGGSPFFGMDDGIILTTGFVQSAPGPNNPFFSASGTFPNNTRVDFDAAALVGSGNPYFDVAYLEFKFVPTTDTISFDYVFFSEEYCFAIDAAFGNDAFAFFLEGPNVQPNGRRNIARLPNGNVVSAATLNHVTTPSLFIDNNPPGSFDPCTNVPAPAARVSAVNYDGYSVKLTAKAAVTPCEEHTLKLLVVDSGDPVFDSGILLEAGSFTAGLIADPLPSVQGIPGNVSPVEGCDTAFLTFSRLFSDSTDLAQPLAVNYNLITTGLGGLNVATNGLDFNLPAPPFVIPPGDSTATLAIPILADVLNNEGVEAFVIRYDGTCNCDANRDTFWIQDAVPLQVDVTGPGALCAGAMVDLTAVPAGGNGNYTYAWPNGETSPTVSFVGTGRDSTIDVVVSDGCGLQGTGSITITAPAIGATTQGTYSLCSSPTVMVPVNVNGATVYNVELEITQNGMTSVSTFRITQDTLLEFSQAGSVRVLGVEDENGCGGIGSGTATITDAGVSVTATIEQPTCAGGRGDIILMGDGGNNNYDFSWDDDPTNDAPIRLNLPEGTYSVTVALRSDPVCSQRFTYTIEGPGTPRIDSIVFVRPACPGEMTTLAPVVRGGRAPYSFIWVNEGVTDSLLNITTQGGTTNYFLIVEDFCGEEISTSVALSYPAFGLSIGGRYSLCNDPGPINAPYTVTGSDPTYDLTFEYTVNGLTDIRRITVPSGTGVLPLPSAGTAVVTSIQNSAGCSGTITGGTVEIVDPQIQIAPVVMDPQCRGERTGTIDLNSTATVPLSYTWSDIGVGFGVRSDLQAGTYGVTIADSADPNCFIDSTFTLRDPAPLTAGINLAGTQACPGEAQTLIASFTGGREPFSLSWSDGITTDTALTFTVVPGNNDYAFTLTDGCGETAVAGYNDVQPDVRASISGVFSVCNPPFRAEVPLTLSGASRYTVTLRENGVDRTFAVTQDTLLVYDTATNLELIGVVADACAGTVSGTATVTDATFDLRAETSNVDCRGAATGSISLNVNGNNGNYDFTWDRAGLDGPSAMDLRAGVYSVTVSDRSPDACSFDTSFVITEPDSNIEFVNDEQLDATCLQASRLSVEYSGGTGTLIYRWSNGATNSSIEDIAAGTYTVSITDANGCEVTQLFNVRDLRRAVASGISASATELSCTEPTVILTAADNPFPVTYSWTGPQGTPIGTDQTLAASEPGLYSLVVTDPISGCTDSSTFNLGRSDDLLQLLLPAEYRITCLQSAVNLTVSHPDYSDPVRYEWRRNGTMLGDQATLDDQFQPGTYQVNVVREDNGCVTTATTEIIEDLMPPSLMLPSETITLNCLTDSLNITVGSQAGTRFAWATADGNILAGAAAPTITIDRAGTYNVAVTDPANGCVATAPIVVRLDGETLTPDAGLDQVLVCTGAGTVLRASTAENLPGTLYRWTDPGGELIGTEARVTATLAGTYTVEAIHPVSGCGSFDEVEVISEAPTAVDFVLQQAPCEEVGGRLFVTGVTGNNPPFTFSSPTGVVGNSGRVIEGFPVGINTLRITDVNGCTYDEDFTVFAPGEFTGRADDVEVFLGEEAELGVETNRPEGEPIRYEWLNIPDTNACSNCPTPTLRPTESFMALVNLIDSSGCPLTLRQLVVVKERELVYVPNAFSPGTADGVNDVFTVYGNAEFVEAVERFHIYNRWGARVFERSNFAVNDPNMGWDGTSTEGEIYPSGIYVYVAEVRYADGRREVLRGDVTLVR